MSTSDNDMNYQAADSPETTESVNGLLSAEQSRRKFLRTAVIGTVGVAGAAGVAGIVLSQHGGAPNLLTIAAISGVSDGGYTMLFEDTDCGTSGNASLCKDFSTNNFGVHANGTSTNPGSFFVVLAIRGLPADTYSIAAQEKLHTAVNYQDIPAQGSGTAALPFAYQGSGTPGANAQTYIYHTGTVAATGPYALNASPYNAPLFPSPFSGTPFTTSATQDVLIFIHVNWEGGVIPGGTGATETIDFKITLTGNVTGSATEFCSTTGVQLLH
jgi:hypothetical protein